MLTGLKQTTAPAKPPVTLLEAKAQIRMEASITAEDDLLNRYINAARQYCEDNTQRQFITATWTMALDEWPTDNAIVVPRPPLRSVTSLTYEDTNGDDQVLDASLYRVTSFAEPGIITPAYGTSWPSARLVTESIRIVYEAGYGDDETYVDQAARQAMLLLVGHQDTQRSDSISGTIITNIPKGVDALLGQISHGWRWAA